MNKDLTILLPIKDRFIFTKRVLRYLDENNCDYEILIADGSFGNEFYTYINNSKNYSSLNITYSRYDFDENFNAFVKKMYSAIKSIDTHYVVWACDDDFYDLSALKAGVKFLNGDDSYSSYSAEISNFKIKPNIEHFNSLAYGKVVADGRCYEGLNRMNTNGVMLNRLKKVYSFKPYECVTRTSVLLNVFSIADELEVDDTYFLDEIFAHISLMNGKAYNDDRVFLLRQDNTPGSAGNNMVNKEDGSVWCKFNSEKFMRKRRKVLDYLFVEAQKYLDKNDGSLQNIFYENEILILRSGNKRHYKNTCTVNTFKVIYNYYRNKVKYFFPKYISNIIRSSYYFLMLNDDKGEIKKLRKKYEYIDSACNIMEGSMK